MNGTPSHHRRRLLGAWAFAALFAALVACGDLIPPAVEAPEITAFAATPDSIDAGGTSTLAWTIAGSATLTLTDGTDPVAIPSGESQVDVSPDATTTYTLTATNAGGSDTAQVTVAVATSAPQITSFTATPASIEEGSSSTLEWTVVGATTITLTAGTDPVAIPPGAMSVVVTPPETTTYTLTATNANGSISFDTMVTVVAEGTTSLSGLTATVVPGSQVRLDWSVLNATSIEVLTVLNTNTNNTASVDTLSGTATTYTMAIPVAARQVVRVCASAPGPQNEDCADVTLTNVVVNALDYDPYDTPYWRTVTAVVPEPTVPGSLRAVVAAAADNSVIGFAADITAIELYGVALYPPNTANVDAHLILDKNVTISGPASGVTLTGVSGYDIGTDPDDGADGFTYRSRMLYVIPGAIVELENLTLTGGTFIYKGGGIRNDGDLTARNVSVVGNRAWDQGGGIYNVGTLTFEGGSIANNLAVTLPEEVGTKYDIRGDFTICMYINGYGGGLWNEPGATASLTGTVVANNDSMVSGGGIYNAPSGVVTMSGGEISGNVGNPVPYRNDPAFTEPPHFVDDPDCEEDPGPFEPYAIGGGIYNGGVFSLSGGSILNNDVNAAGGGLFINRNLEMTTLTNVLVEGNVAGVDATEGFGGGIMHEYYLAEGPTSNYTSSGVTYGTGNTPTDLTQNPIDEPAPTAIAPSSADETLPGRYVPVPGFRDR